MKKGDIFKPEFSFWNAYTGFWTPTYMMYHYVATTYEARWEISLEVSEWKLCRNHLNTSPFFDFVMLMFMFWLSGILMMVRIVYYIHIFFIPRNKSKEWNKNAEYRKMIEKSHRSDSSNGSWY